MDERSRRDVLAAGALGVAAGLAGCLEAQQSVGGTDRPEDQQRPPTEGTPTVSSEFSEETAQRARETGHEVRRAVVKVRQDRGRGQAEATGWVLDAERGYVVTNSHVVQGGETFAIETFDGETGSAERIGYHRDLQPDVALLETDLGGLPELPTGDSTALETGDPLLTVGHPGSAGEWIITLGRFQMYREGIDWVLSSVPTDRGNSGGPLVTLEGDVVGVVSGTTRESEPLSKPDEVFTELPEPERSTTASSVEALRASIDEWT